MSTYDVRIAANADFKDAYAGFAKMQAQVDALNASLKETGIVSKGVNPAGFSKMTKMAQEASATYRAGAASTGLWETQQLRLNSATDEYTKALQKQKLSFKDIRAQQKISQAAYAEQLRMQQMVVRSAGEINGKKLYDVATPKLATKDMDTFAKKMAWTRAELKSGATQLVNFGKQTQWAGRQLTVGLTMPLVAFGAAAATLGYQVDQQLTRIQKVYDTTANAATNSAGVEKELAQVRVDSLNTAANAAKNYGSAAKDTLDVQAELAATGKTGAQLQQSTTQVMRASTLGEMDYNDSLQTSITLSSVFRQNAKELGQTFDYMNSVENATSLQMSDFSKAIPIAAASVRDMGGDVKTLGLLLTAMKERGIGAVQGANAIKALPARLFKSSKQTEMVYQQLTGASLSGTVAKNKGNIIAILKDINAQTAKLGTVDKNKVFSQVFGTYQLTRMKALLAGMGDLEKGIGQVSATYKIGQQSADQWAATSEREIKRVQNSVSGKFKIAIETLKLQLAEAGKPFLAVATTVLTGISKILEVFNHIPGVIKKWAIGMPIVIAAMAGPMLMLLGLTRNLAGNFILGGVAVTKFLGNMGILTKEQKAAALGAEFVQKAMISEKDALMATTASVNALVEAMTVKNTVEAESAAISRKNIATLEAEAIAAENAARAHNMGSWSAAQMNNPTYRKNRLATGAALSAEAERARATAAAASAATVESEAVAATAVSSKKAEESTSRLGKTSKLAAANGGLLAGGMLLSMTRSDSTAQHMSQILITASLLGPVLTGVARTMKSIDTGKLLMTLRANKDAMKGISLVGMRNAKGDATGLKGAANAAKSLGSGLKGAGAAMIGIAGAGTLVVAGLAAAGLAAYAWYKHLKKVHAEEVAGQNAISESIKLYGNLLDVKAQQQSKFSGISSVADTTGLPQPEQIATSINSSKQGQALVKTFQKADSYKKDTIALEQYRQILEGVGGDADKAQRGLEGFFRAAGQGALEAAKNAQSARNAISSMGEQGMDKEAIKRLMESPDSSRTAQAEGTKLGKSYADSVMDALAEHGKDGAIAAAKNFTDPIKDQIAKFQQELSGTRMQKQMQQAGFKDVNSLLNAQGSGGTKGAQANGLIRQMSDADPQFEQFVTEQKAMVAELANQLGIKQKIYTMTQLQATVEYRMQTLGGQRDKSLESELRARAKMVYLTDIMKGASEQKAQADAVGELNIYGQATGMEKLTTFSQAFVVNTGKAQAGLAGGTSQTMAMTAAMSRLAALSAAVAANVGGMTNVVRTAMSGFQQTLVDKAKGKFAADQSAAMAAVSAAGQKAQDGQQKAQEKASDKLQQRQKKETDNLQKMQDARKKQIDAGFQAQEDGLNAQIKAEEDADKVRQQLFDNEIERIQKLADAQNTNIDFNAALNSGNLDEAAKIQNNAVASTTTDAYSKAKDASSDASDKKKDSIQGEIDALENLKQAREDALADVEKKESDALQRRQDRETKALQARQAAEQKGLSASVAANQAAEQKKWTDRETYLNASLDDFMSYTATSEGDLKKHIQTWLTDHQGLAADMKTTFNLSTDELQAYLAQHIQSGARSMVNDIDWQTNGQAIAEKIIKGQFGMSLGQFNQWMSDGIYPGAAKANKKGSQSANSAEGPSSYRHTGGWIDGSAGSRKGVPRTTKGLHRSEQAIVAQRGERVLDRNTALATAPIIDAMESGKRNMTAFVASNFPFQEAGAELGGPQIYGLPGLFAQQVAASALTNFTNAASFGIKNANSLGASGSGEGEYGGPGEFGAKKVVKKKKKKYVNTDAFTYGSTTPASTAAAAASAGPAYVLPPESFFTVSQNDGTLDAIVRQALDIMNGVRAMNLGTAGIFARTQYETDRAAQIAAAAAAQEAAMAAAEAAASGSTATITKKKKKKKKKGGGWSAGGGTPKIKVPSSKPGGGPKGSPASAGNNVGNQYGSGAVAWAKGQIGRDAWHNLCQSFVRTALGAGPGAPSAIAAWYANGGKHTGDTTPPSGVPVFWSGGTYGHTALSIGGGKIISSDYGPGRTVGYGTVNGLTSSWHKKYLGWTEYENGKKIYKAAPKPKPKTYGANNPSKPKVMPGMSNGGFTFGDGIAKLHDQEAVMTKPLTKDFMDGVKKFREVANGGGSTYHNTYAINGANFSVQSLAREMNRIQKKEESRKGRR